MKPWSYKHQRALKRLLAMYDGSKPFRRSAMCPLCKASGSYMCADACPWFIMTNNDCRINPRLMQISQYLRKDISYMGPTISELTKEDHVIINKRIIQLKQWIKYWEEA